jgi:2-methylcitrate dehydratase PrpD
VRVRDRYIRQHAASMTAAAKTLEDEFPSASSNNAVKTKPEDDELPEVTRSLASFVAETTFAQIPEEVKQWLKSLLLDYIGVASFGAARAESSQPFFTAIKALYPEVSVSSSQDHDPPKASTVFGRGSKWPPQAAALLNGAYAHSLDFDDTHMGAVVHPGVTVISAALAEGEQQAADGAQLLTALAVGYEVVCRLGLGLWAGGFERGFHNTSTAGIFGAIAVISNLRGLDAAAVETAFGIGGSKAAGSMQYLQNGSWNKRLHPGFAAHDAFLCVTLAQAGVVGAEKAIEGEHGFLHAYTSRNISRDDHAKIIDSLSREWKMMDTAIKPYPACRCAHPGIDLAAELRLSARNQKQDLSDSTDKKSTISHIESMRLDLSPSFHNLVGVPLPNKIHPENIVDAQFSGYYHVAVAWLYGAQPGWTVYDYLLDAQVHALCEKIAITRDSAEFTSPLQARLTVRYADGAEETRFQNAPLGEPSNPIPPSLLDKKFHSLVDPVLGEEKARQIKEVVERISTVQGSKEDKNAIMPTTSTTTITVNDLTKLFA